MGSTHFTIGALSGAALAIVSGQFPAVAIPMIGAAAIAALLPDIDHPNGLIRQRLGVAGHLTLFWMKHRNITHTLLALALLSIAALLLLKIPDVLQHRWIVYAVVVGYASHLAADMLTKDGIPLLFPITQRDFRLLPRGLCIRSGGFLETLVNGVATAALLTATARIFGASLIMIIP